MIILSGQQQLQLWRKKQQLSPPLSDKCPVLQLTGLSSHGLKAWQNAQVALYSVPCSPQLSTKSHQASRQATQGVEWALCRMYSVHFCQLSNGGTYFLVATWYMILSYSHCPLGCRQHLRGCFAYPLTIAFTTSTWRWNASTEVRNTRPFKTSIPKIYSRTGDTYTVYIAQKAFQFPVVRTQALLRCFGHRSHPYMHCGQETVLVCHVPGCIQHQGQPGPLLFVH